MVGRVRGWRRAFAQSSCDHRGTPEAPGLVATLLSDASLEALGLRGSDAPPSETCGLCYRVGAADVAQVLENLDFREKGGYTREVIEVYPGDASRPPVRALLYAATPDNPGFRAAALRDLPASARTIGSAHGPSGPNREYLEKMAAWLKEQGEEDTHVEELVRLMPPRTAVPR